MVCTAPALLLIFHLVSDGQIEKNEVMVKKTTPKPLVLPNAKALSLAIKEENELEYRATAMVTSARHLTQVIISANESGVDGQIVSFKKLGDKVKKDEEVIDCEYLKGKQVELGNVLDKAKVQMDSAKKVMERALREKDRTFALKNAIQSGVSDSDWDNTVLAFVKAQLDLKMAQHDVVIADQRSSPYNFASMIDGEIISIGSFVKKGFIITKYYGKPIELMRIADLSQLEVTIFVPYSIKHKIESFTIICQGDNKKEKRKAWQSGLEEKNGTLHITICFDNSDKRLRPFEGAEVIVSLKK